MEARDPNTSSLARGPVSGDGHWRWESGGWKPVVLTGDSRPPSYPVWEYKVHERHGSKGRQEQELNALGAEGWELVAMAAEHIGGSTIGIRFILKRLKP